MTLFFDKTRLDFPLSEFRMGKQARIRSKGSWFGGLLETAIVSLGVKKFGSVQDVDSQFILFIL